MNCSTSLRAGIVIAAGLTTACASNMAVSDEPVAPDAVVVEEGRIANSLTGQPGDAANGRKVFADRKLGNCLACHSNADLNDQLFHGEVGPVLDGVANRFDEQQLRTIVVNAKKMFTDLTVMPGFYSLEVGADVAEQFVGKTILTAQQVEDVVAYLGTLK